MPVSADDLREEQRRLRAVRVIVDLTCGLLMQGGFTRAEGEALVAAARRRVLLLFPGREETFDILYARRFERLLQDGTARPETA